MDREKAIEQQSIPGVASRCGVGDIPPPRRTSSGTASLARDTSDGRCVAVTTIGAAGVYRHTGGVSMYRGGVWAYSAAGEQAQSEPTPHRGSRYTVYISSLLSVQILTVKIGKTDLYLLLFSLMLCFLNAMGFNRGFSVWWFCLAGAL